MWRQFTLTGQCARFSVFVNWKKDIEIWCELSDLPETKRALANNLSSSGRARVASSEVSIDILKSKDGVKRLLNKINYFEFSYTYMRTRSR